MAIALIKLANLRSSKKRSVLRGMSNILKLRGVYVTGEPTIVLISTAVDETPTEIENIWKYVKRIYDHKWHDSRILGIQEGLSVAFESKSPVRRAASIDDMMERVNRLSTGKDVAEWILAGMKGVPGLGSYSQVEGKIAFKNIFNTRDVRANIADPMVASEIPVRMGQMLSSRSTVPMLSPESLQSLRSGGPPQLPSPMSSPSHPSARREGGKLNFTGVIWGSKLAPREPGAPSPIRRPAATLDGKSEGQDKPVASIRRVPVNVNLPEFSNIGPDGEVYKTVMGDRPLFRYHFVKATEMGDDTQDPQHNDNPDPEATHYAPSSFSSSSSEVQQADSLPERAQWEEPQQAQDKPKEKKWMKKAGKRGMPSIIRYFPEGNSPSPDTTQTGPRIRHHVANDRISLGGEESD